MSETFLLTKSLNVLCFDATGKGQMRKLPVGTMLTLMGRSSVPRFVEIMHDGEVCHSFEEDLRDRSQKVNRGAFAAKRS